MRHINLRRVSPLLALAFLVPSAVAEDKAPAPREVAHFAPIKTQKGVSLEFRNGEAPSRDCIAFQALDGSGTVTCTIPQETDQLARFRVGVVTRLDDAGERVEAMEVVTWKPATDEESVAQPIVQRLSGSERQRIHAARHITLKPVWNETDGGRILAAFELTIRPDTKGAAVSDAAHASGKKDANDPEKAKDDDEEKQMDHKPVILKLPTSLAAGYRYGVILEPVWKERGKPMGFDVSLAAAAPAKEEATG